MVVIYLIMFGVLLILAAVYCYLCKSLSRISFINKIKSKFLKWIICTVLIFSLLIFFNMTDFIVVIFHLFIFLIVSKYLCNLFEVFLNKGKRHKEKTVSQNARFVVGIILTAICLSIAAYNTYNVWQKDYNVHAIKNIGSDYFKIIHISDSHIGTTFDGKGFKKQIEKIAQVQSDIVVITGDFVDDSTTKADMIESCAALSLLNPNHGVYFVSGNHDKGYMDNREFSYEDLKNELEKNNVKCLEDTVVNINDYIVLVGRKDKTFTDRKDIKDLVQTVDKRKYIIDLNHQPNDYDNEKDVVDLVLSGHTHGGQFFPLGPLSVLFKANDAYYGLSKRGNTTYIVNSGISDWSTHFKTGTRSEYGLITVMNKGE